MRFLEVVGVVADRVNSPFPAARLLDVVRPSAQTDLVALRVALPHPMPMVAAPDTSSPARHHRAFERIDRRLVVVWCRTTLMPQESHGRRMDLRKPLRGDEPVNPRALSDSLDALRATNLGKEAVERIAPADLPSFRPNKRKPFTVMDSIQATAPTQYLDRNLPQPLTAELSVQPLQTQLRTLVSELLYLPQQPYVNGKLNLQLLQNRTVRAHSLRQTLDALDQGSALALKHAVAVANEVTWVNAFRSHTRNIGPRADVPPDILRQFASPRMSIFARAPGWASMIVTVVSALGAFGGILAASMPRGAFPELDA